MSPNRFLVLIPSASASTFISMHYLLNQLRDFDQTCIDTLLGGGEELIRFGDLDLIFKVTGAL